MSTFLADIEGFKKKGSLTPVDTHVTTAAGEKASWLILKQSSKTWVIFCMYYNSTIKKALMIMTLRGERDQGLASLYR
jgi:hypothetical protein